MVSGWSAVVECSGVEWCVVIFCSQPQHHLSAIRLQHRTPTPSGLIADSHSQTPSNIYRNYPAMDLKLPGLHILYLLILLALLITQTVGDSLEAADDAEFSKLIKEEKYVVALFCSSQQEERCEDFEGELASAREDLIDVMEGDGWVIKLVDSKELEKFVVGKTEQPVVVMFRSGLPVIYNGKPVWSAG